MLAIDVGDTFADRFRIEAELGHGGMGSVYKATQLALNRVRLPCLFHLNPQPHRAVLRQRKDAVQAAVVIAPNGILIRGSF